MMTIFKKFCVLLMFLSLPLVHANEGQFYLKVGSGASFAQKAMVDAPSADWDPSPQGYNGNLGTRMIFSGGIGYEFPCILAMDFTASYRPNFKYRKFQTTPITSITPGNLGDKTREFDLDVSSAMVNFYFSGKGVRYLNYDFCALHMNIFPFIGFGVGGNQLTIRNFRSTGLPAADAPCLSTTPSPGNPGYASENQLTQRYNFGYQVMAGLEARFCDKWGFSVGYRWFDACKFKGPRYIRDECGYALDVLNNEWRIKMRAHEVYAELKVYL